MRRGSEDKILSQNLLLAIVNIFFFFFFFLGRTDYINTDSLLNLLGIALKFHTLAMLVTADL